MKPKDFTPDTKLSFEKYDNSKPLLKTEKKMPAIISKILMNTPEAYFYWSKYAEIEDL